MTHDKDTKEYFEKWGTIKLSHSSRARLEKSLLAYAQFHPVSDVVRVGAENRLKEQVPMRTTFITRLFNLKITRMTAIILITLLLGGGTSFAAQSSIPGDFLYPVKVEVNENVRSVFAISDESEARLQATLAEERLKEAETLATRGELNAQVSAEISERLRTHVEQAEKRNEHADAKGTYAESAMVRASLEGTLRTYGDILSQLNVTVAGNKGDVLITEIQTFAQATAQNQATATADVSISSTADVEAFVSRAGKVVAIAESELADAKEKLSVDAYTRIKLQYDASVKAYGEAQAHLQTLQYREAYTSAQKAIRLAHEVDVMIASSLQFKINLDILPGRGVLNADEEHTTNTNAQTEIEADTTLETKGNTEDTDDTRAETDTSINGSLNIDTKHIDVNLKSDTAVDVKAY